MRFLLGLKTLRLRLKSEWSITPCVWNLNGDSRVNTQSMCGCDNKFVLGQHKSMEGVRISWQHYFDVDVLLKDHQYFPHQY